MKRSALPLVRSVGPRATMPNAELPVRGPLPDAPILICYDGSDDADRAITEAAALLGPRSAVVLDVGPTLTAAESLAAMSPVAPTATFEELNADDALVRARAGAERARKAGFVADARAGIASPVWAGIVYVADEIDAAVIVLGSRGLTGAREVLEGSVSHDVAEHAGRPEGRPRRERSMTVPRCPAPRRDDRACGTLAASPSSRFCKRHEALAERWGEERVLSGDYPGNAGLAIGHGVVTRWEEQPTMSLPPRS
jgi:nucleotide-binding universal stress UspA family protein